MCRECGIERERERKMMEKELLCSVSVVSRNNEREESAMENKRAKKKKSCWIVKEECRACE